MCAKLKIVFLVILTGVFFFPPDGVDALKCVCTTLTGHIMNATKPCGGGIDIKGKNLTETEIDCPDGVCYKVDVSNTALGKDKDYVERGCRGAPIPHLGCDKTTTVTKFTTPENKTMSVRGMCYCNSDLCNSVAQLRGMSLTQLSVSAIFVGVVVSRIGGIQ